MFAADTRRPGIHHVTAIASSARRNLDFYATVLGLRLVKKTVNFDDPGTYHLYYGNESGAAGTILTFFPWEHAAPGRLGVGQAAETAFRVPERSIGYWAHRFIDRGVAHETPTRRFGETVLPFKDTDGTALALVGVAGAADGPDWTGGDVPAEHALRGFAGITLLLGDAARTGAILTEVLGFEESGREDGLVRHSAEGVLHGARVDVRIAPDARLGRPGAGSVHHVAFRAVDDAAQAEMVRKLAKDHRIAATEQKDRQYFRSVYFREPGGVLFEIATDAPGFAVDEPVEALGGALKLPPFLEARRAAIEASLPALS